MQYLANWRMQLAANYLLSGSDSVAAIAERVGYTNPKRHSAGPSRRWSVSRRAGGASSAPDGDSAGDGYWAETQTLQILIRPKTGRLLRILVVRR